MDCALELLNEGKRDLLVSAIPDAVANFSKCCEMLVSLKGEMGVECTRVLRSTSFTVKRCPS